MQKAMPCALFRMKIIILLLSFFAALFSSSSVSAQNNEQPDSIKQILDAHNTYRFELSLPALIWSPELAKYAQSWANELSNNRDCQLAHRPRTDTGSWNNPYFGENIFAGGGTDWVPSIPEAVDTWGEEKKLFDTETKLYKPDGKSGHYTQIVWKSTRMVGCATVKCANGLVIVVCNYYPMGNLIGKPVY
ncbi:MAG: CAP domain-containing protein [Chitinophagaceae bacterium]